MEKETFGFLVWELPRVHRQPAERYEAAWNEAIAALDAGSYPTLTRLRDELCTSASEEQFEYGLARLVASLRPEPGVRANRGKSRRGSRNHNAAATD